MECWLLWFLLLLQWFQLCFRKRIGFTHVFHWFLRVRAPALQLLNFSMGSLQEVKHSELGSSSGSGSSDNSSGGRGNCGTGSSSGSSAI